MRKNIYKRSKKKEGVIIIMYYTFDSHDSYVSTIVYKNVKRSFMFGTITQ